MSKKAIAKKPSPRASTQPSAAKAPRTPSIASVRALLRERAAIDERVGVALSARVATAAAAPPPARPPIQVPADALVGVRIVKAGVVYGLSVNLVALPFNENGFYSLTTLVPGADNSLVWTVFQSKETWAFQIDLIVNNQFITLDSRRSSKPPDPTLSFPIVEQLVIRLT